jgi:hypothetical protein
MMEKYKDIKDYINQNLPQVDSFKGEPTNRRISKRQKKKNRHKKEMGN